MLILVLLHEIIEWLADCNLAIWEEVSWDGLQLQLFQTMIYDTPGSGISQLMQNLISSPQLCEYMHMIE
jgi:hypothetical protein